MRWVTRSQLHLDRMAASWLILRFIDQQATFEFVGWEEGPDLPEGAIPFGIPDVELSAHDENGTTFEKLIRRYGLEDPAFDEMASVIGAGVRWALRIDPPPEQRSSHTALGRAFDALGAGIGVFHDDLDIISQSMSMYDGLYVSCQMVQLHPDERSSVPRHPVKRQAFWRQRLLDPRA